MRKFQAAQHRASSGGRQGGFTLIELLVTVAVLAVIAGIAVPGFSDLMSRQRSMTLANDLVTALNLARSEAVKRGIEVRVCAGGTGGCGGSWNDGWAVVTEDDEVLRIWGSPEGGASITAPATVTFEPLGNAEASANLVSHFSGCADTEARHLRVTPGGSISVTAVACDFVASSESENSDDKGKDDKGKGKDKNK